VLNFLRSYQLQHQRTLGFGRKLIELGLLQPVQASVNMNGGAPRVLSGLRVVERAKLKELDPATLHGLLASDELELIYLHLHSLPNLRVIGERMPRTEATAPEDTAPPAPEVDEGAELPDEWTTKH
jgi:hypothetical protein